MKHNANPSTWFVLSIRCVLFATTFILCGLITHKELTEIAHWWTIIAWVINMSTIGFLSLIFRRNHITYRKLISWKKNKEYFLNGLLFIIIMILIGIGGMYLAGALCYDRFPYLAPMMIAPLPRSLAIINVFVLPITTTLAEDGLYLGYGVNNHGTKWAAILLPAFFYALQHSFIPTIIDLQYIVYRFLSFLPLTIWVCYQYYRKKNLRYIMIGHWILNIATSMQIVMTSFMPDIYEMMLTSV